MTLIAHQVLPSCSVILGADSRKLVRIVHPRLCVTIEMDRDTVQLGNRGPRIGVAAIDETAAKLQHVLVEGEVGMR
jgi:hypothetical protein